MASWQVVNTFDNQVVDEYPHTAQGKKDATRVAIDETEATGNKHRLKETIDNWRDKIFD